MRLALDSSEKDETMRSEEKEMENAEKGRNPSLIAGDYLNKECKKHKYTYIYLDKYIT